MVDDIGYFIKPAGRHIMTIGRDLIHDQCAAVLELVKNAYDADSPQVTISLLCNKDKDGFKVVIEDSGHGMTRDIVINKWLVPSTDDKLKRKVSPKGRTMQGRKGVGRYAASILGDDLLLETVSSSCEQTTVYVEWKRFEKARFLSDVEILVDTEKTNRSTQTKLTINNNTSYKNVWDNLQIKKLKYELKKLISPVHAISESESDVFNILIKYDVIEDEIIDGVKVREIVEHYEEEIKPYPILDLFDYKISGTINKDGYGKFKYYNQRVKNSIVKDVIIDLGKTTGCGEVTYDLRVYDREKEAIDNLILRGLKDDDGNYVGKLQARQLLNDYNGVGVYRNGFRIRPLGDADFDWLKLNSQRIQNPSLKIGINQIIGFVYIQSEELSGLEEKSARDGLRENEEYKKLIDITHKVINELENRRFSYRKKAGLSRKAVKIEREFEKLFEYNSLKKRIKKTLRNSGVLPEMVDKISNLIDSEGETKNKVAEEIKRTVAIYQGQATLGRIVNVILHEGRRPLNFFKNQVDNVNFWATQLKDNYSQEALDEIVPITNGFGENAKHFVELFGRLDPLAAKKRNKACQVDLNETIQSVFLVFENELFENQIKYSILCPQGTKVFGWKQDIYVILTNLIDNSIFWMLDKKSKKKEITLTIEVSDQKIVFIDYRDTGPGIEKELLDSGVIFDPEFSTKDEGSGLGLAIAGEAASRNGFSLKAFDSDSGAYFRLQPIEEDEE